MSDRSILFARLKAAVHARQASWAAQSALEEAMGFAEGAPDDVENVIFDKITTLASGTTGATPEDLANLLDEVGA